MRHKKPTDLAEFYRDRVNFSTFRRVGSGVQAFWDYHKLQDSRAEQFSYTVLLRDGGNRYRRFYYQIEAIDAKLKTKEVSLTELISNGA